jgi:hypothetical protein
MVSYYIIYHYHFRLGFSELPSRHNWEIWGPSLDGLMGSNLAHSAHLGGFLFGWLMWKYENQTNRSPGDAIQLINSPLNHVDGSTHSSKNNQVRAELDVLLDKISLRGFRLAHRVRKTQTRRIE